MTRGTKNVVFSLLYQQEIAMTDKKPHDSNTVTPYFTLKGAGKAMSMT